MRVRWGLPCLRMECTVLSAEQTLTIMSDSDSSEAPHHKPDHTFQNSQGKYVVILYIPPGSLKYTHVDWELTGTSKNCTSWSFTFYSGDIVIATSSIKVPIEYSSRVPTVEVAAKSPEPRVTMFSGRRGRAGVRSRVVRISKLSLSAELDTPKNCLFKQAESTCQVGIP